MNVNEKIRIMREVRNWTQEEMAEKLGMSHNGYAKIERGETKLYLENTQSDRTNIQHQPVGFGQRQR